MSDAYIITGRHCHEKLSPACGYLYGALPSHNVMNVVEVSRIFGALIKYLHENVHMLWEMEAAQRTWQAYSQDALLDAVAMNTVG